MTELKTLKDLRAYCPIYSKVSNDIVLMGNPTEDFIEAFRKMELIDRIELRQELIKWIKELRKENEGIGEYTYVENTQAFIKVVQNNALIKEIKYFANITEEDLR